MKKINISFIENCALRIAHCALCILAAACSPSPEAVAESSLLPPVFPDYIGVTIPVGIAPLNFCLTDGSDRVDVTVRGSREGELHVRGERAAFDIDDWHSLVARNRGGRLRVTVCARTGGQWTRFSDFDIHVSRHDLGEWGLTYRRVAPGYEIYSRMGIYQRDLSTFDEYTIIDNSEVYGMCINCHTACRTSPDKTVMHVRGDHGATMVQQSGQREWLKAKSEMLGGAMVYPNWHPSGQYCAFSTNQTRQAFHVSGKNRIEVFDLSSDIFVYHPDTRRVISDSLIATKDWSENCPVFSPDGRRLYFITCRQQSYPMHYKDGQYNLCSISFDPATETFGQKVDTLLDAAAMGKSLTWPRPSYDGRLLMFTLCDYGYFSIWHPESDQWIMDLQTGKTRRMDEINSAEADSYHNWSGNSRWVVFTSRRNDGLYSQLFLTSVDETGRATKPFLLPQENPAKYYDETLYSFNTPDFTKSKADFDTDAACREIISDKRNDLMVKR